MSNVVIWIGPVSADMLRPHVPDTWEMRTFNQPDKSNPKNIGSKAFGQWAHTLGEDPLTTLAGKDATRVVMAGFSAAHGAHEVILGKVAARNDPRLVGLFAADAYYSAWGVQTPKPGHRAWLRIALRHGLPAWFTTSTRHPPAHPSASESFLPMANALGMIPVDYAGELAGPDMPAPRSVRRNGPVCWFEYGELLAHNAHALQLAPLAVSKGPFLVEATRSSAMAQAPTPSPAPAPAPPPADNTGRNILLGLTVIGLGWVMAKATR